MKKIAKLLAVLLILFAGLPQLVNAVSWSPIEAERVEKAAKGIMEKGAMVCLFQSGTADVKKAISMGDVLIVYREGPKHELKEVGKIRAERGVRVGGGVREGEAVVGPRGGAAVEGRDGGVIVRGPQGGTFTSTGR